ncbi:MAG TPA: thioredoxin domain-containing protein [Steroidobacteraceae bacterium]|nr:thioredoxin domain-containing protein [Steroidobacteraceae bacterium]
MAIVKAILPDRDGTAMHGQPSAGPRNRLAHESSPYLLQHAANPVDWYPWGDEAIARARELDRPILLSIGYSACHWCHVMAHESFEDEATAAVMNRLFVNVKVDREERPDLDKVYQLAHQLLTQRGGGWPLTMFLAPDDLTPFFGGTYFPKVPRYGMPAFPDLLERVAAFYRAERAGVSSQNAALRGVFGELEPPAPEPAAVFTREPIKAALRQLAASFDPRFGGFGPAPKFPHAASIELLLRESQPGAGHPEPDLEARSMAVVTLRRMAEGGLFDQLGGGFCRYSVDPFWMIPHFEKMLYDNGPLLALCAQAAVLTGDAALREAALATADWTLREMRAPGGGFYAALDADSEGHEGRFYVWQRDEVERLLAPDEYRVLARRFGLDREPNFEGAWHLHAFVALDEVAREMDIPESKAGSLLDAARAKLLAARGRRVRPGLDDKVLTSWNALMIRGLAIAGRLLDEPRLTDAAVRAVDFLRREAWRDGVLLAAWKAGVARFPAYLDDHAFLLDALLEVLQSRFRAGDLRFACEIADRLLARFADRERGGFWFTAEGEDPPLHRPKSFADESMASGNGVAAQALARLGWLAGDTRYLDAAEAAVRGALPSIARAPQAHASMLNALDEQLDPVEIVIIRGESGEAAEWLRQLSRGYAPRRMTVAIPTDAKDLPDALTAKPARERTVAYVCRGPVCSEPRFNPGDLAPGAARP